MHAIGIVIVLAMFAYAMFAPMSYSDIRESVKLRNALFGKARKGGSK